MYVGKMSNFSPICYRVEQTNIPTTGSRLNLWSMGFWTISNNQKYHKMSASLAFKVSKVTQIINL